MQKRILGNSSLVFQAVQLFENESTITTFYVAAILGFVTFAAFSPVLKITWK